LRVVLIQETNPPEDGDGGGGVPGLTQAGTFQLNKDWGGGGNFWLKRKEVKFQRNKRKRLHKVALKKRRGKKGKERKRAKFFVLAQSKKPQSAQAIIERDPFPGVFPFAGNPKEKSFLPKQEPLAAQAEGGEGPKKKRVRRLTKKTPRSKEKRRRREKKGTLRSWLNQRHFPKPLWPISAKRKKKRKTSFVDEGFLSGEGKNTQERGKKTWGLVLYLGGPDDLHRGQHTPSQKNNLEPGGKKEASFFSKSGRNKPIPREAKNQVKRGKKEQRCERGKAPKNRKKKGETRKKNPCSKPASRKREKSIQRGKKKNGISRG